MTISSSRRGWLEPAAQSATSFSSRPAVTAGHCHNPPVRFCWYCGNLCLQAAGPHESSLDLEGALAGLAHAALSQAEDTRLSTRLGGRGLTLSGFTAFCLLAPHGVAWDTCHMTPGANAVSRYSNKLL